jgi:hypothetical protein
VRGEAALLLTVLLALALPGAAAQTCKMEYNGMVMEYPCGSGESAPQENGSDGASWWDKLGVYLAVIGILGSLGAAGYTYHRVRSRRRALVVTLAAVDRAYLDAKNDPDAGIARLNELRAQVRVQHDNGKMDDSHFLELDRRVLQYLSKLRLLEIDRRFAHLPPLLLAEIRRLLADGILSQAEADLVEVRAAAYRVPETTRAELARLTRRWATEDGGGAEPAPVAAVS